MTHEEVTSFIRDQGIRFIRLQFTDIFGQLKNIAITASQMERALANQVTIDGSSIEGFLRLEESDMMLYPDLSTFALLPWHQADDRVARLICDVHTPDGKPFPGDPRYILRQVIAQAHEMGYTFNVGPECEFFLFHTDANGHPPPIPTMRPATLTWPHRPGRDRQAGHLSGAGGHGLQIEASHHESAPGQHEIDFKYADALRTADNIMTFKLAVKTIAQQHGLHATFMPKPIYGTSGSGMHTNMSLFKHSDNLFYDPKGKGAVQEAYSFIAGLLRHISGITAVCNPWSTPTSGWCRVLRPPFTSPGRPGTARSSSASPARASAAPGWSCAAPTPPATPIWRWPCAWPPGWRASARALRRRLKSLRTSTP